MAIKVIGAGFGRTGTLSLKTALEMLGFGPCYHMVEVFDRPGHIDAWYRTSRNGKVDFSIFDDFRSIVDWPAVHYWRDLIAHYPHAKVVLTVRDGESWYKSAMDTIFGRIMTALPPDAPEERRRHRAMTTKIVLEDTFGGRATDKQHAIEVFNRHNEEVRAAVDLSRLLVYQLKEGWDPLCRFLGVPIPKEPFPRLNDTAAFLAWMAEDDRKK
jgi:hypothetical protein